MASPVITKVEIPGFEWHSGKVRDRAVVDKSMGLMVFVTTDRISAFDVVLPTAIPEKGRILNQFSIFWRKMFQDIVPNDVWGYAPEVYLPYLGLTPQSEWAGLLEGRTILAREALVIPVECVVRGYISGSLWQEYKEVRGEKPVASKVPVLGYYLPGDLQESAKLVRPIFTPATKAATGHDVNLIYGEMVNLLAVWFLEHPEIKRLTSPELLAQNLRSTSIALYLMAREHVEQRGIIIADTKFEFGFAKGELILADEVLTPDSSRFWNATLYKLGRLQPSLDKQPVRDWLRAQGWIGNGLPPELPLEVIKATTERYREAFQRLTQGTLQ